MMRYKFNPITGQIEAIGGTAAINGDSVTTKELKLTELPVYENEAAAVIGGLSTDVVYKTSTGELRIKL